MKELIITAEVPTVYQSCASDSGSNNSPQISDFDSDIDKVKR